MASAIRDAKSYAEVEALVGSLVGPTGLMEMLRLDSGEVLRKAAGPSGPRSWRFIVGNPLIMKTMVEHVPDAAAYAPVTIRACSPSPKTKPGSRPSSAGLRRPRGTGRGPPRLPSTTPRIPYPASCPLARPRTPFIRPWTTSVRPGREHPAPLMLAEPRRILILRYSALGDVVLATSILEPLRRRFPAAELEWVTDAQHAPLLAELSRVYPLTRWGLRDSPVPLAWALRGRFDLVVDLQHRLRGAPTGVRVPTRSSPLPPGSRSRVVLSAAPEMLAGGAQSSRSPLREPGRSSRR
jgi:hypothetical protein